MLTLPPSVRIYCKPPIRVSGAPTLGVTMLDSVGRVRLRAGAMWFEGKAVRYGCEVSGGAGPFGSGAGCALAHASGKRSSTLTPGSSRRSKMSVR